MITIFIYLKNIYSFGVKYQSKKRSYQIFLQTFANIKSIKIFNIENFFAKVLKFKYL